MKIAIIRRKFNPFGGAERFIIRAISGLKSRNVDISIIAESWGNKPIDSSNKDFELIKASAPGKSRTAKFMSFSNSVHQILKSHHFDLTQSHERLLGTDIYRLGDGVHASWVSRYAAESSWLTRLWLRLDPYHRQVIKVERAMAEDMNLTFVANSALVEKEIKTWYQVPDNRVVLIENGIDTKEFLPSTDLEKNVQKKTLGLDVDLTTIVFIGSGFARKGAFELAQAIKLLPKFQLVIVGHDKQLHKLKKYVEKLSLTDRIHIAGAQHDVKPYLAAADIFCLPSSYDSFPNAALEALCCGLPIVVTDAVGLAEAVMSEKAGEICYKEASSIAHAIETCRKNLTTYSANALKLSKRYDISIANQKWLNLYNQLIEKKKVTAIANSSH